MDKISIPDEALFYISERTLPINAVIDFIYENPSQQTIDHFKNINLHLKNGQVKPGQMVIITPPDASYCHQWENVMMEAAAYTDQQLSQMSAAEKVNLARHYDLIQYSTEYVGAGYGLTATFYEQKKKHVERVLKEIERLYKNTLRTNNGKLATKSFFQQRQALFRKLDYAINGMLERRMFSRNVPISQLKNTMGISSKAIMHQWKHQPGATNLDGFKSNYKKLTTASKSFTRLGYLSIGLDIGYSAAAIHEACTVDNSADFCRLTTYSQTGRAAGSIAGGGFGGWATSYVTCNLVFGLESAGTSLLWCTIVASVAGGYAGSQLGSHIGQSSGEAIYEYSR
ncbi:hypothetical protein [Kangiella spongicola]|uniref:Uncharacterized protein n=1 Tax=Kangiella spongicola TaxID=796379 RepID=A0A318D4I1_9GAMM|nr:hypothetical protein [Kangiella spongicola]PXF64222.1 hypothetical protein DL796_03550 [Kangiella spongicola]